MYGYGIPHVKMILVVRLGKYTWYSCKHMFLLLAVCAVRSAALRAILLDQILVNYKFISNDCEIQCSNFKIIFMRNGVRMREEVMVKKYSV